MKIIKSFYNNEDVNGKFTKEQFLAPSIKYVPIYAWMWNDKLEEKEIVAQLEEMSRLGVKGLYMIPEPKHFRRRVIPTDLEPEYLSEEYMHLYRFAMEEAAKRGMYLWLYDEGGWPSGGACGEVLRQHPNLKRTGLECMTTFYSKGSTYEKPENILIAFKNTTEQIQSGYVFQEDTDVDEYYIQTYYTGESDFPDILLTESTDSFLELTHEAYKPHLQHMFGKDMLAVFTDEARGPSRWPFSQNFLTLFEEKYGYSIVPYAPFLWEKAELTEDAKQAFIDYYELCSELYCTSYLLREREWCNANGMAFTGHLDKDDEVLGAYNGGFHYSTLRAMRCLDIPGIDVIWRQIWRDPNALQAGYDFFPRIASSAAAQNGAGKCMTETFGVYGHGLTYQEMRYVLGAQAIRGINIFNIMLFSYGRHDHYMYGEAPNFSEKTNPDLKIFNQYAERLQYLVTIGKMQNDVALYMPAKELHIAHRRKQLAEDFKEVGDQLENAGIGFDIFDDEFLENVQQEDVDKGQLCLGLAKYTEVIIPNCDMLLQRSVKILNDFITDGGKVYTSSHHVQEKLPAAIYCASFKDVFTFDERIKADKGILCQKRICENGTLLLFFNKANETKNISLQNSQENAYLIDITNGKLYHMPEGKTLLSGETMGVFFTNETIDVEEVINFKYGNALNHFKFKKTQKLTVGKSGLKLDNVIEEFKQVDLMDWQLLNGMDFTGSGIYETEFKHQGNEDMMLDLGDVRYACEVWLNDVPLGVRVMPPYQYEITSELLKEENKLSIRVTNSAANAYLYSDAYKNIEKWKMTPYFENQMKFAFDSVVGGLFGPVVLFKKNKK